jgi:hypothetical protein
MGAPAQGSTAPALRRYAPAFRPAPEPGAGAAPGSREVTLYALVLLTVAALRVAAAGGPYMHDDSYQYLSAAENLRARGTASTSLVFFDVERSHGVIPAPLTTFPSGYPALIAVLASTGLRPELAGWLISLVAAIAVVVLLGHAGRVLSLAPFATRVAVLGWALNAHAAMFATAVLTESLFTAVSLAGIVLLLPRPDASPGGGWRIAAGGLLVGVGYHVRYAGLFFAAALHVWALREVRRGASRRAWLGALALCDAVAGAVVARNLLLTGTWMGGNGKTVIRPLWSVVRRLGFSAGDMLLGASGWLRPPWHFRVYSLLAAATLAGATAMTALLAWAFFRRGSTRAAGGRWPALVLLCATVFCLGTFYAGATTVISFGVRMFVPVLPLALLLLGAALTHAWGAAAARLAVRRNALLAVLAVAYAGVNLATVRHLDLDTPHVAAARALEGAMPDGGSLASWIARAVPPDAVIASTVGLPTGHLLHRRTLATVNDTFSDLRWTADVTRTEMQRFGASYLVLFPEALRGPTSRPGAPEPLGPALDSPFLRALAAGDCPSWLELAARNERAMIFRRRD